MSPHPLTGRRGIGSQVAFQLRQETERAERRRATASRRRATIDRDHAAILARVARADVMALRYMWWRTTEDDSFRFGWVSRRAVADEWASLTWRRDSATGRWRLVGARFHETRAEAKRHARREFDRYRASGRAPAGVLPLTKAPKQSW